MPLPVPKSDFFQAPSVLQAVASGIRVTQGLADSAVAIKTCALPLPGLVFQMGEHQTCIQQITTPTHNYTDLPPLFLHAGRLEPSTMHLKSGRYTTFQVAFYPWALRTVFGIEASTLVAKSLGAESFGALPLQDELLANSGTIERIRLIEHFLQDQLVKHGQRDASIETAVAYIDQHITSVTVHDVTTHLGISNRLLQKRFSLFIGCSPQKFIQIKRMNMALHLMWTGQYQKLSDIAYALNYYDQAHFIRDMKTFSWLSPTAITQSVTDFRQDESGIAYI